MQDQPELVLPREQSLRKPAVPKLRACRGQAPTSQLLELGTAEAAPELARLQACSPTPCKGFARAIKLVSSVGSTRVRRMKAP